MIGDHQRQRYNSTTSNHTATASFTRRNVYGTAHLQSNRKEKKVVEFCLKYLAIAFWNNYDNTPKEELAVIHEGPEADDCEHTFIKAQPNGDTSPLATVTAGLSSPPLKKLGVEMATDHECSYCLKVFQSKFTLDIHLMTKRHDWQLKRAIENMNNINSYQPVISGRTETSEQAFSNEGRYSNGSIVSSEEGYYSTDSDDTRTPQAPPYFMADHKGEDDNKNNDNNNPDTNDEEQDSSDTNRMNLTNRRSTKERLKRKKMEELKVIYKQYAASRGSDKLYKSLLDTYADFEITPPSTPDTPVAEINFPVGVKTNVSAKTNRRYSVCEKEALMRKDLVLTELADTEKNYVDDLGFVVNEYFPLMDKEGVSEDLKNNFEKIFGNVEEIYKFHSRIFLEKIEDCLEDPQLLNETFCKYEDELATLYSQYCKCKSYADEALHTHEDEMEEIRRRYFPNQKLSIKDYLVKPVQRLMKYQLLLITAKKYSEKSGVDIITIKDAIEVMDRVPKLANDAMHVELIKGHEGFLQSEDLLFQDTLGVSLGKESKAKNCEMRVFIFDSQVIFCDIIPRKGRLATYKCIGHGQTNLMGITDIVENEPLKFAIFFRKFNSTSIYICQTETKAAKEEWIQVLKDVIALQTIIMNRASQHTSLDKLDGNRKREGVYRRSSRGKYVNDLVVGETLRQALQGHPRIGEMSERLKINIERYILNELIMAAEGDPIYHKQRSQSLVPISSLVTESELRPTCRPRCNSSGDAIQRPPNKDKSFKAKKTLVESVTHLSFGQLDPN